MQETRLIRKVNSAPSSFQADCGFENGRVAVLMCSTIATSYSSEVSVLPPSPQRSAALRGEGALERAFGSSF